MKLEFRRVGDFWEVSVDGTAILSGGYSVPRELLEEIKRKVNGHDELKAAATDGLEALASLQDLDDGSLVSPARHRLRRVLAAEGLALASTQPAA